MSRAFDIGRWRLYVITDEQLRRDRSHREIAAAAIRGGADVIQLRDKSGTSGQFYQTAKQLRDLTRQKQIPFIINDRLDIALAVDADGLHVGQMDLPAEVVRKILGPHKILGVSCGSLEEGRRAEQDGADYLGVGPVFEARATKADAGQPLGLALVTEIRKQCRLPIVAIGGINALNAPEVLAAGADALAVISAIVTADDVELAARRLKTVDGNGRKSV